MRKRRYPLVLGVAAMAVGFVVGWAVLGGPEEQTRQSVSPSSRGFAPRQAAIGNSESFASPDLLMDLGALEIQSPPAGSEILVALVRAGVAVDSPASITVQTVLTDGEATIVAPSQTIDFKLVKPGEIKEQSFAVGPLSDGFYELRTTATATLHEVERAITLSDLLHFRVVGGQIEGLQYGEWQQLVWLQYPARRIP